MILLPLGRGLKSWKKRITFHYISSDTICLRKLNHITTL